MISIVQATQPEQISAARELFLAYANSLGFSLCFQRFDEELASLPGRYAPPEGRLLLGYIDGKLGGCGAFRAIEAKGICEMKRLYARPEFRGRRLGVALARELIAEAQRAGYSKMRLDTVPDQMRQAVALYRSLGFYEIDPYNEHPLQGTLFMELSLSDTTTNAVRVG